MKRFVSAATAALLAALLVFGVFAAEPFYASEPELHVKPGENVRIVYCADAGKLTSCGIRLEPVDGYDYVDSDWLFDEDSDSAPLLMQAMEQDENKLHPAVCAFAEPTEVKGNILELVLKPNASAAAETELTVTVSYSGEDMENKRETVTVKIVLDDDAAEPASGTESTAESAAEGSEPAENGGGFPLVWVIVGAAVVICAVCAFVFMRKKK